MEPSSPTLLWTLRAIARLERDVAKPLRSARLTEPGWPTWRRTAGRLGWAEFVALLHEDLAHAFPTAFDLSAHSQNPLAGLSDTAAEQLIREAITPSYQDTQSFLRAAAQGLGLPVGGAVSELPKVQAFQRVVELPGSGGRIAAQQVLSFPELSFNQQFLFVADSDAERVLIGIAALELRSNAPEVVTSSRLGELLTSGGRVDKAYGFSASTQAQQAIAALRSAGREVRCI